MRPFAISPSYVLPWPSLNFTRIRRLPPYVFAEVNRLKAAARAAGRDVIDFGMGNPDMATPPHVVAKLIETVQDPRTHRYSNSKGITGLRKAISGYYQRRFEVDLDPESEVIVTLGSKEGLANLAQAITSRPATWCWCRTRLIRSTPSAS